MAETKSGEMSVVEDSSLAQTKAPIRSDSRPPSSPPTPAQDESVTFPFPPHYSFPPFFTIQTVLSTRASQLATWSNLVQSYCRHHRIFQLVMADAIQTDLFNNKTIGKRLILQDANLVIDWMASTEGGRRAEWIDSDESKGSVIPSIDTSRTTDSAASTRKTSCWIYWRRPEEWAALIEEWIHQTGKKGSVLTVYEIAHGEDGQASESGREFHGIDIAILLKALRVLTKKGRAQIFGGSGGNVRPDEWERMGVKFF